MQDHDYQFLYWQTGSLAACREGCEKPIYEMMHEEGSDKVVENEGKDNNYELDEGEYEQNVGRLLKKIGLIKESMNRMWGHY